MVDATHKSFIADDRSYFSLIKKDIHKFAADNGFPTTKLNSIDIVVAELTSNIQKYSTGGAEILVGYHGLDGNGYIDIVTIDNGPGIADVKKVMVDGYSTSSTLGQGLGTIRRMADDFDLYSQPRWGTIVLARVYKLSKPKLVVNQLRSLVVAKPGETLSGDGVLSVRTSTGFKCLMADGLGHGPFANAAVNEAAVAFEQCKHQSPSDTLRFLHEAIKKTRGIVANIIFYNGIEKQWTICGIGNIATKFIGGMASKNYLPHNGIIGHNIPNRIHDLVLSKDEYNQFISCSDGMKSRWDIQKFPMINKHDSLLLCVAIYKEYARKTDDMSVTTCKIL